MIDHENVQRPPERAQRLGHRLTGAGGGAEIAAHGGDEMGLRDRSARAVADGDFRPGPRQEQRRRAPDASAAARHERVLPSEVDHPLSRSSTRSQITC